MSKVLGNFGKRPCTLHIDITLGCFLDITLGCFLDLSSFQTVGCAALGLKWTWGCCQTHPTVIATSTVLLLHSHTFAWYQVKILVQTKFFTPEKAVMYLDSRFISFAFRSFFAWSNRGPLTSSTLCRYWGIRCFCLYLVLHMSPLVSHCSISSSLSWELMHCSFPRRLWMELPIRSVQGQGRSPPNIFSISIARALLSNVFMV